MASPIEPAARVMKPGPSWILMTVVAVCVACTASRETVSVAELVGSWEVEIVSTEDGAPSVKGVIALDSIRPEPEQCPAYLGECGGLAIGTIRINLEPLLGHDLSSEVNAGIDSYDGAVVIQFGECCDRGELGLRGHLWNGEVRGTWEETYVGGGRTGTFVMRRKGENRGNGG